MIPVPVTILTGFLGSGKTTVLNQILSATAGVRIGLLVNEFGQINIDSRLIARRDGDLIELTNGCVCCAFRDDLLPAIAVLLERPQPPQHIIIETTGLADPAPVARQLLDPRVQGDIRLDAIITLIDAANFDRNLGDAEQAYAQIAAGDLLLINKVDLVEPAVPDQIEEGLRCINPRARMVRCAHGQVDPSLALGLHVRHEPQTLARAAAPAPGHGPNTHASANAFRAITFQCPAPVDLDRFAPLLEDLPARIIRGKGILWAAEAPARLIFHLVGERWTLSAGESWRPGEVRTTEIVFIGKDLTDGDRAALEARLRACVEESHRS